MGRVQRHRKIGVDGTVKKAVTCLKIHQTDEKLACVGISVHCVVIRHEYSWPQYTRYQHAKCENQIRVCVFNTGVKFHGCEMIVF